MKNYIIKNSRRVYTLNKKDWYRFEKLCKAIGFNVSTGVTYKLTPWLSEIECPYLQIIDSSNNVVAIANIEGN